MREPALGIKECVGQEPFTSLAVRRRKTEKQEGSGSVHKKLHKRHQTTPILTMGGMGKSSLIVSAHGQRTIVSGVASNLPCAGCGLNLGSHLLPRCNSNCLGVVHVAG